MNCQPVFFQTIIRALQCLTVLDVGNVTPLTFQSVVIGRYKSFHKDITTKKIREKYNKTTYNFLIVFLLTKYVQKCTAQCTSRASKNYLQGDLAGHIIGSCTALLRLHVSSYGMRTSTVFKGETPPPITN